MKKILLSFILLSMSLLMSEIPQAPVLKIINKDAVLKWTATNLNIEVGISSDTSSVLPNTWLAKDSMQLNEIGLFKVFARENGSSSISATIYNVQETFPGAVGEETTTAINMNDQSIIGWADSVISVTYGSNVSDTWKTPEKALGVAVGSSYDVVCLGDSGQITLKFDPPIVNGNSYDFCVFENSFSNTFLEIAFVEVSSDGINFIRFDNAYLGVTPVGAYGSHDTKLIGSLAGKYKQGYGNPFDLEVLKNKASVLNGTINLNNINYVRIVDIVGDGNTYDSFGRKIYDPYPTYGSGGFDLDAIGVLNQNNTSIIKNTKIVEDFKLKNYPNPFNPQTTISFNLKAQTMVNLSIFNSKGEFIKNIINKPCKRGNNNILFDATNLNSGIYYYKLKTSFGQSVKKMLLVK